MLKIGDPTMTENKPDRTLEGKLAKAFGLEHLLRNPAEFDRVLMDKIRSEKFLSKMSKSEEEWAIKAAVMEYIKKRAGGYDKG